LSCRPRDRGRRAMGLRVVLNFLDTLPKQLFISQQFSKVVPSAYDPWGKGEDPMFVPPITKDLKLQT